jgi:tRNA-(ms[2]io[6]A)-hydroxylase
MKIVPFEPPPASPAFSSGRQPLLAATPPAWVEEARVRWRELLIDHAACEKKAASTALALMFAYPEDGALGVALSRLAREELKHFEQVDRLMRRLGVPFVRAKPGRYATGLRRAMRTGEPGRKTDLLLVGALIEARSCERFRALAPVLEAPMAALYAQLQRSEARHFEVYLALAFDDARAGSDRDALERRLRQLLEVEAELATSPDRDFRFHSGPPA